MSFLLAPAIISFFSTVMLAPFQASWVYILSLLGFTANGITMGSVGAYLMSLTAVANGGAVASGSFVACLQGLGATAAYPSIVSIISGIGVYGATAYSFVRHFFS